VRLLDFPGRWMVLRTADLAAGLERALIDIEPPAHPTVEDLAELESRAEFAVGDGHDATLVAMNLARMESPRHECPQPRRRWCWSSPCGVSRTPWP
jgi:hypothetical protein